ncbi:MAG: arsenate reductase (glutaredoxin) [Hyphomicrobiales bacterium]|nr:MAG: arsenate reductase (glutaredoxin) [Hyphomicrobiales bacterium]
MPVEIWHNPRCSKSRQTLKLLEDRGIEPKIRLYLDNAPTKAQLLEVISQLGIEPRELMRKGEAVYKENDLAKITDPEALVGTMVRFPILIERPIVIGPNGASIGRPPERVLEVL